MKKDVFKKYTYISIVLISCYVFYSNAQEASWPEDETQLTPVQQQEIDQKISKEEDKFIRKLLQQELDPRNYTQKRFIELYNQRYKELMLENILLGKLSAGYSDKSKLADDIYEWIFQTVYQRFIRLDQELDMSLLNLLANYLAQPICTIDERAKFNKQMSGNEGELTASGRILCLPSATFPAVYEMDTLKKQVWPANYKELTEEQVNIVSLRLSKEEWNFLGQKLSKKLTSSYINLSSPEQKKEELIKQIKIETARLIQDAKYYIFEHLYYRFIRPGRLVNIQLLKRLIERIIPCSYQQRKIFYDQLNKKGISLESLSASGRIRCEEHTLSDWWQED